MTGIFKDIALENGKLLSVEIWKNRFWLLGGMFAKMCECVNNRKTESYFAWTVNFFFLWCNHIFIWHRHAAFFLENSSADSQHASR